MKVKTRIMPTSRYWFLFEFCSYFFVFFFLFVFNDVEFKCNPFINIEPILLSEKNSFLKEKKLCQNGFKEGHKKVKITIHS